MWKALPQQQREGKIQSQSLYTIYYICYSSLFHGYNPLNPILGIKTFVVAYVIETTSSDESLLKNKMYISKLNMVLVQVRIEQRRDALDGWVGGRTGGEGRRGEAGGQTPAPAPHKPVHPQDEYRLKRAI